MARTPMETSHWMAWAISTARLTTAARAVWARCLRFDLATNTFTTLVNFNGSNGANPNAGVTLDGQGHLYGTTYNGSNNGTLYKVNLATHSLTTLVNFNGNNGASPYAGVTLDGSGNLYGTTSLGGSGGYGIVYKVNLATKALTTLVTFNGNNGAYPVAGVTLDGNGKLYGTTYYGGSSGNNGNGYGIVYKVNLATKALTTLVTFNGSKGATPSGDVTLDGNGFLYGTTRAGGSGHDGTVYKVNLATNTFTTLVTFNGSNGTTPYGGVTLDGNGFLYGTTEAGGGSNDGKVFQYNLATHALTALATFSGSNGVNPNAGVALDSSGSLYGATDQGGTHNNGVVYEVTPNP